MRKLFVLSLLLFVSILLTGCVKKSEDKVSQDLYGAWETYSSSDLGITFKYPPEWGVNEINATTIGLSFEDTAQEKIEVYMEEMTPSYGVNISVENNEDGVSAKEEILSTYIETSRDEAEKGMEEVTYAGLEGTTYDEFVAPSSGKGYGVLLTDGKKFYRFVYSALATKETHEKYLDVFEGVLSTLELGYKVSTNSPEKVVEEYMDYTLGTLPTAEVDYDSAKTLLDSELQVQFDDPRFVPVSYGIQDGPDKAEITNTSVDGDYAEVEVDGIWGGDVGRQWLFMLDKSSGRWLITHVSFVD